MTGKQLGIIKEIHFGLEDNRLGVSFTLGGERWGVETQRQGCWYHRPETAKWTPEEQIKKLGETMLLIGKLLTDAKKRNLYELKNVPVEATFEGNVLKDWRILTEVLP